MAGGFFKKWITQELAKQEGQIQELQREVAVLKAQVAALEGGKANDLAIEFNKQAQSSPISPAKGNEPMANKKANGPAIKCPCLKAKGGKGAVMAPITITTPPASITLQPIDASGNPVSVQPADNVTGTLSSDSSLFTVAAGTDSLHYVATLAAGIPAGTVVNLSATLSGTMGGSGVNFTASVQVTVNITPPLPQAVDLDIILG